MPSVDEDFSCIIDSLEWVAPRCIVASSLAVEGEGHAQLEAPEGHALTLTWGAWAGEPGSIPQEVHVSVVGFCDVMVSGERRGL